MKIKLFTKINMTQLKIKQNQVTLLIQTLSIIIKDLLTTHYLKN